MSVRIIDQLDETDELDQLDDFLHVCSILRRSTAPSSAAASASAAIAIPAPEWLQWLLNFRQWLGGDTE